MITTTGQPIECWRGEAGPHQQELLDLVRAQPAHERQEERHPVQDVVGAPRLVQAAGQLYFCSTTRQSRRVSGCTGHHAHSHHSSSSMWPALLRTGSSLHTIDRLCGFDLHAS